MTTAEQRYIKYLAAYMVATIDRIKRELKK